MRSIWFRKSGKLFTKWEPKRCSISSFILAKTTQCAWDLVLFLVLVLVRMGLMKFPFYVTDGDGELLELELVSKGKLDSLLLHLGKPVLVLGDLRQGGLDEVALHAGDG